MLYLVLVALAVGLMVGGIWLMKRPGDESSRSMAAFKRGLNALDEQSRSVYGRTRPRAGRYR
ncbi:MAG TPA: hypothetical protein VFW71_11005 [Actinomycetota bacterium]|nr:hypothetical protein [Actinomycetota bacterium]